MAQNDFFPEMTLEATAFTVPQLQEQIRRLGETQRPQMALAGRSNVGKSSLINALARRKKLAKVSATPGKTRSVNFYRVSPVEMWLVDLPGYGYARCSREEQQSWRRLIERYLSDCPDLKALVLLLDCRLPPQLADRNLADFARARGIPLLPAFTKADKCSRNEIAKRQREWASLLDGQSPLPVSSLKNSGLEALWSELFRAAGKETPPRA